MRGLHIDGVVTRNSEAYDSPSPLPDARAKRGNAKRPLPGARISDPRGSAAVAPGRRAKRLVSYVGASDHRGRAADAAGLQIKGFIPNADTPERGRRAAAASSLCAK